MQSTKVQLEFDKCHMVLNLPVYLDDATSIRQLKKMFTLIHRYKYQNEQAISDLESYMKQHLEDLEADWSEKSRIYQREYQHHAYILSPKIAAEMKRNNKRRENACRACKKRYERFQKIIGYWDEIKSKYA